MRANPLKLAIAASACGLLVSACAAGSPAVVSSAAPPTSPSVSQTSSGDRSAACQSTKAAFDVWGSSPEDAKSVLPELRRIETVTAAGQLPSGFDTLVGAVTELAAFDSAAADPMSGLQELLDKGQAADDALRTVLDSCG